VPNGEAKSEELQHALDRLLECERRLQHAYDLEKPIDSFLLEAFSKAVDSIWRLSRGEAR
jgi:hypothetical protein